MVPETGIIINSFHRTIDSDKPRQSANIRLRSLAFRCGYTFDAFKLELKNARKARVNLELAQWAQ
jgi:hypothetical protein